MAEVKRPHNIFQKDERTLGILWNDGVEKHYDVIHLRENCTCAQCRDEWTQEKLILPGAVSQEIRPASIEAVGHYGLRITWSDGHSAGIYTFDQLYSL